MSVEVTTDLTVAVPTARPQANLPRPFGRYTLLYHLARGGMGEVYLAVVGDLRGFERVCVVKTVRAEYCSEPSFVDRFLDEGRILTQLSHGHIAQTIDVGRVGEQYFVALEYVEGKDLARVIDRLAERRRPIPVPVGLTIAVAVLDALDYAHRRTDRDGKPLGLIHRDISPQNVLVSYEGDVKLIDFGNARTEVRRHATAAGIIFGKPGYIAPEQARGARPDPRSDLYSVGVTLWELLAGRRLLQGDLDTFLPLLRTGKVRPDPLAPHRADVPPELDRIIARAMAPEREQRPADAAALRAELAALLASLAPRSGPADTAALMHEVFRNEISVERRLVAQLIERAPSSEASAAEVPTAALGSGAMRYRLVRKLGHGGMGEVWAAEHVELGKVVALKVLHRDFSQNQSFVERFRREARAVARLGHPSIVQVSDFGETSDGRVFFAMEKLEGESLEGRLGRERTIPETEALEIAERICSALVAAHGEGIVHRDLKPDNVFLCTDGSVKLLDFGIAKTMGLGGGEKLTRAGEIFGTPEYMAPEQACDGDVDPRSDLYSVGVMLYEMTTGSLPFRHGSAVELLHAQIHDVPDAPRRRAPRQQITHRTERAILTALAKDPSRRFAGAEMMAAELHAARTRAAVRPRRRAAWIYAAAGAIVLGAVAALGWGLSDEASVPTPRGARAQAPRAARVVTPPASSTAAASPAPIAAPVVAPAPVRPVERPAARSKPASGRVAGDEASGDVSDRLRRARGLLAAGDRGACAELRDLVRQAPSFAVRFDYARSLVLCGRHDQAITEARRLYQQNPRHAGVQVLLERLGATP